MSKKTTRSTDAARTPGTAKHTAPTERAKREARKVIADNIARIEQNERGPSRTASENSDQPQQPQPDQHQRSEVEDRPLEAAATPATTQPGTPATTPKTASGSKRQAKTKPESPAQPAATSPAKGGKEPNAGKPAKEPKRLSCIDAAAQIIGKEPIGCADLIAEMGARGLWTSPNGKTPDASLYAAVVREISAKGDAARFKKVDRGLFVKNG